MSRKKLGRPIFVLATTLLLFGTVLWGVEGKKERAMVAGLDGSTSVSVIRSGVKSQLRAGSYLYDGDQVLGGTGDTKLSLLQLQKSKLLVISLKAKEQKTLKELLEPNEPSTLRTVLSSLRKAILGDEEAGPVELGGVRDGQALRPTIAKSERVRMARPAPKPMQLGGGGPPRQPMVRRQGANKSATSYADVDYDEEELPHSKKAHKPSKQTLSNIIGTRGDSGLSGGGGSRSNITDLFGDEPPPAQKAKEKIESDSYGGGKGGGMGSAQMQKLVAERKEFHDLFPMATKIICQKAVGAPLGLIAISLPTTRRGRLLITLIRNNDIVGRVPAYKKRKRALAVVDLTKFKVKPGDAIYYYLENEIPKDHIWFRVLADEFYVGQRELIKRAKKEENEQVKRAIFLLAAQRYKDAGAYRDAYIQFLYARKLAQPKEAKELDETMKALKSKMEERP